MSKKYTVKDTQSGKTITFNWNGESDPTDDDIEEVFSRVRASSQPSIQPISNKPVLQTPTPAIAGSSGTIASSPFGAQYAREARQERGDIAKNAISFGLPFLATGLSAGYAIPASGALSATGEVLGQKVSDLITGQRTPTDELVSQGLTSGAGGLFGEGVGRGLVGLAGKGLSTFAKGFDPSTQALANKYGMTLPASAVTTNRAVPLIESVAGKSVFGNKLTQMTLRAEEALTKEADRFISRMNSTPDGSNVGVKVSEGLKNYRTRFMTTKNQLYDAAMLKKGDVNLIPTETIRVLDDIIGEIKNTANPDLASLKYFQKLKKGLAGGDGAADFVSKNFPPKVLEMMKAQGKIADASGVDGTMVLNTIKQIGRDANFNSTKPVAVGFDAELKRIGATLSGEFDDALGRVRPDLKTALDRANAAYRDGIGKLNSEFGRKIKKFTDAGQYDKIAETVLNKSTSIDDLPKIFEVVGEDGKQALKANLADRMLGSTKRNAKQVFTPSSIDKTIKEYGDARLKAIYTPEEYSALKELSKLTYAVGAAQKVAEGSQTTFTAKIAGLVTLAFTNPVLALQFFASDAAFAAAISSKVGQQFLRSGYKIPQVIQTAVPAASRVAGQSLSQQP